MKKVGVLLTGLALIVVVVIGIMRFGASRVRMETLQRKAQLVEAVMSGTHAHQVLLLRQRGVSIPPAFETDASEAELRAMVAQQELLLSQPISALTSWITGTEKEGEPGKQVAALLAADVRTPVSPGNLLADWFTANTSVDALSVRSVASVMQTMLDVERDADEVQSLYGLYVALGLPVHLAQLGLDESEPGLQNFGKAVSAVWKDVPFDTDAATVTMLGTKMKNWGQRYRGIRDMHVLAREWIVAPEFAAMVPAIQKMQPRRIAVIGHSYSMDMHWASASAFAPVVSEMVKMHNPDVEFCFWQKGGMSASGARKLFYDSAIEWKPDVVLFVILTRSDADTAACREMIQGFTKQGAEVQFFDRVILPGSYVSDRPETLTALQKELAFTLIPAAEMVDASPLRAKMMALDGAHAIEPFHRIMAERWLRYLTKPIVQ